MTQQRQYLNIPYLKFFHKEMGRTPEERALWFRHMQETQPVVYHEDCDMWEVFRYEDVDRILKDYRAYSTEYIRLKGFPDIDDLGNTDPPRHHQLRGLVSQAFTPHSTTSLAPRITRLVDRLLDQVAPTGHMDVAHQLAFPLPVQMIVELMGVPLEDQDRFCHWSYQLMGALPNPDDPNYTELMAYFHTLLQVRESEPRADLLTALLTAEAEGEHLLRDEVVAICMTLLMAGHITTTMLITHAIERFSKNPAVFEALYANPTLIASAVEEVLRYEFSTSHLVRLVRHDTVLAGQQLKAGQIVVVWTAAANFDPTVFADPEKFDITRTSNPHLTFGHGVHVCLGAPLARLEGRIALERLLARFKHIRLDPAQPPQYMNQSDFIQSLPVLFDPA